MGRTVAVNASQSNSPSNTHIFKRDALFEEVAG